MSKLYLDKTGLSYLWTKIKTYVQNTIASYVKKSGDTMTGILNIQSTSSIADNRAAAIRFTNIQTDNNVTSGGSSAYIATYDDHDNQSYGVNMVIQSAGNMIIGGGESPSNTYNTDLKNSTGENLYLTADSAIYFYPNANTYANHKSLYIDGNGDFRGARYIFAHYFNSSANAETPTADSYLIYANSDGYFRKSTLANVQSVLGLNDYLPLSGGTLTGDLNLPNLVASEKITVGNHVVLEYNSSTASLDFSFI